MILRARYVLPCSQPPIEDGAVLVRKNRIAEVGRWSALKSRGGPRLDLGEVLLTPGLINAHCHLDYTDMAGLVPSTKLFTDWLKLIVTAKGQWTDSDYAASWRKGAAMLVATGATTVADIEALPELLPAAWLATPLRVISFLEMIALTGRRPAREIVDGMVARVKSLSHPRCRAGLSPHAPYSTVPELLRLCARAARRHRLRICTHIAESDLEFEMFARADGEMYRWLSKSSRDMADCGLGSPVAHMRRSGALGKNLLGVHLNYLGHGDALALAENCVSVVHCPRSHAFFRHAPFPLRRLQRAGVNVCLGTDSLASVRKVKNAVLKLDMFEEMRALARADSTLAPKAIFDMATRNGARALGREGEIGVLHAGALADMIGIPFTGRRSSIYEGLIGHEGPVALSLIDGEWAVPPRGCKAPHLTHL